MAKTLSRIRYVHVGELVSIQLCEEMAEILGENCEGKVYGRIGSDVFEVEGVKLEKETISE